jgi:hypothetical protein
VAIVAGSAGSRRPWNLEIDMTKLPAMTSTATVTIDVTAAPTG